MLANQGKWWRIFGGKLDFAAHKRTLVSFFNIEKPETSVSDGYGRGQELPKLTHCIAMVTTYTSTMMCGSKARAVNLSFPGITFQNVPLSTVYCFEDFHKI